MKSALALAALLLPACVEEPPAAPPPDPATRTDALQVMYLFDEGSGLDVHDRSGIEPAFDLQLDNLVTNRWIEGGGIEITGPSVITSVDVAEKVFVECVKANAVSIELWIEPALATQDGPATIFTYGKNDDRNVTLRQNGTRYRGSVMTSNPDPMAENGVEQTTETPTDRTAVAVQHVVYTRDVTGGNLYIDGADAIPPPDNPPTTPPETLDQSVWSPAYQLAFGNNTNGGRPWLGKIYRAAVYAKKLTPAEISAKFTEGY